jgi:hypothetical protein
MPRPGSALPSPIGPTDPSVPIIPKLKTVAPQVRRSNEKPDGKSDFPELIRRRRKPETDNPFAIEGVT